METILQKKKIRKVCRFKCYYIVVIFLFGFYLDPIPSSKPKPLCSLPVSNI